MKQQSWKFFGWKKDYKKAKITKQSYACKGYVSTDIAKILNSFNPDLQVEDSESIIKHRRKDLLTGLKWFNFVTTLLSELKRKWW